MPTDEAEDVSEYVRMRTRVLLGDAEDDHVAFLRLIAGPEIARTWGIPDDSLSPLATQTRQLTTPGLYGRTPDYHHVDGRGESLVAALKQAKWWIRAQTLQFLVVGVGAWWRRITTYAEGDETRIADRLVTPADVWVQRDEYGRLVHLRHLRIRAGRYVWDVYDVRNADAPFYRVHEPGEGRELGKDVSSEFFDEPLVGEGYPFRRPTGAPVIPWVLYTAEIAHDEADVPQNWRRATYRGTFRACAHWTYTSRCALFATGEHVILGGPDVTSLAGIEVVQGDGSIQQVEDPTVWTTRIQPGTITVVPLEQGTQLSSVQIGPGANLPNLLGFSSAFNMLLATGDGLHPTDATRQSANPSSGAALEIQASSRREFAAQVEPGFRGSDEEALALAAWGLIRAGVDVPDTGWVLTYYTIPLSPQEQEDLRADLDWKIERGQLSRIDARRRLTPGITRDQAIAELVAIALDEALLDRQIEEALASRGLAKAPPPPPSPPPTPTPIAPPPSDDALP